MKFKGKILSLTCWKSLLYLTVLITFPLKCFTTLVVMATLLLVFFKSQTLSSLCHLPFPWWPPQMSLWLMILPHSFHSLSLVASLFSGAPLLWVVMALDQCFQSNIFLSPEPQDSCAGWALPACVPGPWNTWATLLHFRLAVQAVFPTQGPPWYLPRTLLKTHGMPLETDPLSQTVNHSWITLGFYLLQVSDRFLSNFPSSPISLMSLSFSYL